MQHATWALVISRAGGAGEVSTPLFPEWVGAHYKADWSAPEPCLREAAYRVSCVIMSGALVQARHPRTPRPPRARKFAIGLERVRGKYGIGDSRK